MPTIAEKLETIAENEQKVYDKGWDDFLNLATNNKTNFKYLFYESKIKEAPYIDMSKATSIDFMFANSSVTVIPEYNVPDNVGWRNTFYNCRNLTTVENQNIKGSSDSSYIFFDCKNLTNLNIEVIEARMLSSSFSGCKSLKKLKKVIQRDYSQLSYTFYNCVSLHTIEELEVHCNTSDFGVGIDDNTFYKCSALKNIKITGELGKNCSFKYSAQLTSESLHSILRALKDFTGMSLSNGTSVEFYYTIYLSSESWAILDAEGAVSPNGNTWKEYLYDKKYNWA